MTNRFVWTWRMLSIVFCLFAGAISPADEKYTENPGPEGNGDVTIGPDYKIDPDLTDRGNPKGQSFEFAIKLADSKIFPGTDATLDSRKEVRVQRRIFV